MLRHALTHFHIDIVDIRTLFPIDFDGDKVLIHEPCHVSIGERLTFHHMTPVAGGIADGEKNRFALTLRLAKGCLAPWVPRDRIGGMLEQVGTALEYQSVVMRPAIRG